MKNTVDEVITAFTKEELRQFKYFLKRNNGHKEDREDLHLVESIRDGSANGNGHSGNARHQTSKRIKKQLEQFISLENLRWEETSRVQNLIEVAKYLFKKNLHRQGWHYLQQAEQMALSAEEYELLDYIYYLQISYSSGSVSGMPVLDVPELIAKREKILPLVKKDSDANSAYALLVYEISETFARQLEVNMDELVSKILSRYDLENKIYESPKIYMRIVNMVCKALREKKDYQSMKEYAINHYRIMEEKKMFEKMPQEFLMEFLRYICNSTIRTKDYANCEAFLKLYTFHADTFKGQYDKYPVYYLRSNIIKGDLCMCTNRLEEARRTLIDLYKKYSGYKEPLVLYYLLRANVIAVHFKSKDFKTCTKLLTDISKQDPKLLMKTDSVGIEALLLTELYRAIIQYENNDMDYAWNLLSSAKRKFAGILSERGLKREAKFIQIMERMINNPSYVKSNKFTTDHNRFVALKEYIPNDKEYISLNAWLSSKLRGNDYYECFMELVR